MAEAGGLCCGIRDTGTGLCPLAGAIGGNGIGETESRRSGVPHVAGLVRAGVLMVSSNVGGSIVGCSSVVDGGV